MSRRKKRRRPDLPAEVQERLVQARTALAARLPAEDPAALFQEVCADLGGYEAALLEALAREHSVPVLNFLYQLSPGLTDKSLVKTIRRVIYRLEQAGLRPDETARPEKAPLFQPPARPQPRAFLSQYFRDGGRGGILALPGWVSGLDVGCFLLSQATGLRDFVYLALPTGKLDDFLRETAGEYRFVWTEVPPEQGRYVLAEAAARAQEAGSDPAEEYMDFVRLAGGVPLPEWSLIYERLDAADVAARVDPQAAGERLLAHELVAGWAPGADLDGYRRKLEEAEASVLVLSKVQKAERREGVAEEAAREFFGPERRAEYKRRFEETALLFWEQGEKDLAEDALAAALDLDREAGLRDPASVVRQLMRRWLGLDRGAGARAGESEEAGEGGSGLIVPGRFRVGPKEV